MNICIVGSGISGLMTIYKLLSKNDSIKITLYEKNRIGGHSHTHTLPNNQKVDIGFQVFNKITYPNIINFFDDLDIPIQKSNMSFSVITDFLSWGTGCIMSIIVSLFNFSFFILLYDMWYFHYDANKFIEKEDYDTTIEQFCVKYNYSKYFTKGYLIPFCSAVWSSPPEKSKEFLAFPILKFMKNHGLLSFKKFQWYTLSNRSQEYIDHILTKYSDRITIINKSPKTIKPNYVDNQYYDHIIFACHGNSILNLLENPKKEQLEILNKFIFAKSKCYLHSDLSLMPKNKYLWSSWNFVDNSKRLICTYWCNKIQSDLTYKNLFFTLNPNKKPENCLLEIDFDHPVMNKSTIQAQQDISKIQGKDNFWYVGAYLANGFHEDGVVSGLKVVNKLLGIDLPILKPLVNNCSNNSIINKLIIYIFKTLIREGKLSLQIANQEIIIVQGKKINKEANIQVINPKQFIKSLLNHNVGFGEAYINRNFTTTNLKNLLSLISININNSITLKHISYYKNYISYYKNYIQTKCTIYNSKKNVEKHYDLSNDLYMSFLDKTMTYSSAIFKNLEVIPDNLEFAQKNKYNRIIEKLGITQNDTVLEIGCGWGGFAIQAVLTRKCRVTCITLSENQFNYFKEKIKNNALLESNINLLLTDYRTISGQYDKIVSIEMIEAVGFDYIDSYFSVLKKRVKPSGQIMIQAICIPDKRLCSYKNSVDFIQKYIFPGGFVPSLGLINKYSDKYGLIVSDIKNITIDYANTLAIWKTNFNNNYNRIENSRFDLRFKLMWNYYLDYCEVGFRNNMIQTYQIVFKT